MATTVDQVTLKINVEGKEALDQTTVSLNNIDKSTKATSDSLKAFNLRNVSYQIQDLAVQIAGGTSAFVAFGQQLPQLLSGFGVMGAVIGAVAAVGIPLLKVGLEALGFDFRSLNQRLSDLGTASQDFIKAQQANLASVQGLTASFGGLSTASKEFFQIQQDLAKQKALFEFSTSISELQSNLKNLNPDFQKFKDTLGVFSAPVEGVARLEQAFKQLQLGLNSKQAEELSKILRSIDPSNPEKTVVQITNLLQYLRESGIPADKLKIVFEQIIDPALKIANAGLDIKKNIKAAGEEASALQVALLGIQSKYQPDVNASRRAFDQIRAAELEGQQKIAEFVLQSNEKTAKDNVNRSKEIAAYRLRVEQDVADKVADVRKAQDETTRSAVLTADAKLRQLGIDQQIAGFGEQGKLATLNAYQYQVDLLRAKQEQVTAEEQITEQVRKGQITAAQSEELRTKAVQIRVAAEETALATMDARQKSLLFTLEQQNKLEGRKIDFGKDTLALSDRERKNRQDIFDLETARGKELQGVSILPDLEERAKREREINDAYDERIIKVQAAQDADLANAQNFEAGWKRAFANYVESSQAAFSTSAKLFDTVTKGMEDSLVNFFKTGKLDWKNFLGSIAEELLRSNIKSLIAQAFGGGGGGGSLLGTIFSGIGSLLGFADGTNSIPTNGPVLVGERGPELLMGAGGMSVTPNGAFGSAPTYQTVNYNINAVDAPSFKAMIARDPQFIHAVASQGALYTPGRR